VPPPESEWFFPAFVVFWLAICGVLSITGGWRELAERFKSDALVEGERFRFRSGALGSGFFPVSYGGCLFATVGPKGFALSILFLFRFLHPRLVVPWSAVERCEPVKFWLMNYIAVHIVGFSRRILFRGSLGKKVLETWAQARKSS
jgi:hypothetical protein